MKEINIKNIYKPRYRVAAQASNKTYLYKNSRLRGFFNIRAEKIIRGSLYRAYFIVQKALK
jgi:hypothetical protein